MDANLSVLENRIDQLVQLCVRLRKTNTELRQHLASSLSNKEKLEDKVNQARVRLEALLEQIPEGTE